MSYLHPPAKYGYYQKDKEQQTWTEGRSYLREAMPEPEGHEDPLSDIETL